MTRRAVRGWCSPDWASSAPPGTPDHGFYTGRGAWLPRDWAEWERYVTETVRRYREIKAKEKDLFDLREPQLNALGYDLQRPHRVVLVEGGRGGIGDVLDVIGQLGQDLPRALRIEIAGGRTQQVLEHLLAQVGHHPPAHPLETIGIDEAGDATHQKDA